MRRSLIIAFLVIAAVAIALLLLFRRRANAAPAGPGLQIIGATATTPQPQTNLAALFTGTAGQLLNAGANAGVQAVAGYLPAVGEGLQANQPQSGATPPWVVSGLRRESVGLPLCQDVPPGVPCKSSTKYDSVWGALAKAGVLQ